VVWLALSGLAAFCYFVPKLTGRPLQSRYLALFAFWTLILFGTWVGIPPGATLPAWMPTLSTAAALMMLVPVLTAAVMLVQTLRSEEGRVASDGKDSAASRHPSPDTRDGCGGPLCYVKFGLWSLVLSGLMLASAAVPRVSRVTDFTWFGHAQNGLRIYGFFAMTMFGAAYYLLPRVTGAELPFAKLVRAHFWCGVIGTLLLAVPLAIGGLVQGAKWLNPEIVPVEVARATLMFLRISTLGDLLLLFGNLLFLLNVSALIVGYYRSVVRVAYAEVTALEPAGAKP
jgi:cytochrome c oxidase cbb3-type subunit 1